MSDVRGQIRSVLWFSDNPRRKTGVIPLPLREGLGVGLLRLGNIFVGLL
jgi:hypothetical protein